MIIAMMSIRNGSLSARRAWIEMIEIRVLTLMMRVALRKESVDRNLIDTGGNDNGNAVALRKESVDRNAQAPSAQALPCVALRKESVDRNDRFQVAVHFDTLSLSARRAWIEIFGRVGG